jgi:hypothetical protein
LHASNASPIASKRSEMIARRCVAIVPTSVPLLRGCRLETPPLEPISALYVQWFVGHVPTLATSTPCITKVAEYVQRLVANVQQSAM